MNSIGKYAHINNVQITQTAGKDKQWTIAPAVNRENNATAVATAVSGAAGSSVVTISAQGQAKTSQEQRQDYGREMIEHQVIEETAEPETAKTLEETIEQLKEEIRELMQQMQLLQTKQDEASQQQLEQLQAQLMSLNAQLMELSNQQLNAAKQG